jgi:hypothetical protein
MPSAAVTFRPTPIAPGTGTPASAYVREQRILRAYHRALHTITEEAYQHLVARLAEGCMRPTRNADRKPSTKLQEAREERIYDDIPELIQCLGWDEQQELYDLLVQPEPDLYAVITLVLSKERILLQREPEYTGPADLGHAKAAGLGKISSQNYGILARSAKKALLPNAQLMEQSDLQLNTQHDSVLNDLVDKEVAASDAKPIARPLPPCKLRPKRKTLQAQVARAQERKRLKRKRRR